MRELMSQTPLRKKRTRFIWLQLSFSAGISIHMSVQSEVFMILTPNPGSQEHQLGEPIGAGIGRKKRNRSSGSKVKVTQAHQTLQPHGL